MNEERKQTIFDLPKVIAVGIASPVATMLTSRFGVAGTMIGLALSAVILTALVDFLKVYLARAPATVAKVPHTVVKMPGGLRTRFSWRNILGRLRAAFSRFSSLPAGPVRRRSILIGSIIAAAISFFVGLSIVTALELGVGKSLSCWAWDNCPTESSTDDGGTSATGTLPSILGGGRSARSIGPEVQPPSSQQPIPVAPGSPSQPEGVPPGSPSQLRGVPGSEEASPPQPGQRWTPSVVPEVEEDQRPSFSGESAEEEQQRSAGESEEDQQRSPAGGSEEDQQRGPADEPRTAQQPEDQRNQPSSGSDRQTREPMIPSVPWTT